MANDNKEFELNGVNHLALVCKDMARTVDFYSNVLGMPLTKTIDLPGGGGQHFFFDMGGGDQLAFFWFPDAPEAAPGIASPKPRDIKTAHASMNHLAFDVPLEKIEAYQERLVAKGIEVTPVVNHDDSPEQTSPEVTDTTFCRSIYFFDPDGILLEFCAWARPLTEQDVRHRPATAADAERYLEAARRAREETAGT